MSTWTETVTYIKSQLRPGVLGNTNVQKILNAVLAVVQQINGGDFTPTPDALWKADVTYAADIQPVLWQDQWLVSNIADNLGNVPISTSGVVHPSWRVIGSSAGSGIRAWQAIVYPNSLELIFHEGKLYYLNREVVGDDPFVSVDFSVEVAEDIWLELVNIPTDPGNNILKADTQGSVNQLAKFLAGYILGDSQITDDGISVMIGTLNSVLGDRLRIAGGKLNITNWVTASGAFDRLSITFGEERGFGYDPFTNVIFLGGVGKFPWKVDGDAPDDSFNIDGDGSVMMANLGAGIGEVILYSAQKKLVRNNIIPIQSSDSTIKFDLIGGYIHGNTSAITANIAYDFTGAILGTTVFMLHRSSTIPSFPAESRIIKGSYVVNTDNYIWFCITRIGANAIVQVTISQA